MKTGDFLRKFDSGSDFSGKDLEYFLTTSDQAFLTTISEMTVAARNRYYGNRVFLRGLIEITNFCRNDCLYCGLRRSNADVMRYRMTEKSVLEVCRYGYSLGLRTFVLQGGEDSFFDDIVLCRIVESIKSEFADCAVTLSLGEKTADSYVRLFAAGADRYLLRHETADRDHYGKLHPKVMSYNNRMNCLENLKAAGFQTGCGFMVGSPFQSFDSLASDINFIMSFRPQMCGIGPFISHRSTPFCGMENGSVEYTLRLISLIRILIPDILMPATTALCVASRDGLTAGVKAGANVIMPNITPVEYLKAYEIYDGKGDTSEFTLYEKKKLEEQLTEKGYIVDYSRGDSRR